MNQSTFTKSHFIQFTFVLICLCVLSCKKEKNTRPASFATYYSPSSDTRIMYVSQTGDDETAQPVEATAIEDPYNPGDGIRPFKTIAAAMNDIRDGYPDWVMLKRGDVWTDQTLGLFYKSGRSAEEPILVTYYGFTGNRPLIKCGRAGGFNTNGRLTSNISIVGLDLYAHTRDPHSLDFTEGSDGGTGIRFVGGGSNILIENCVVRYFKTNITCQSFDNNVYTNFVLRRSIILNSYSFPDAGHSSGIFLSGIDGILLEENLFDHNGWNTSIMAAEPTMFNHNAYIQYDNVGNNIIVKSNIFTRASSHGVHGRPGGLYENNLFVENSISLQMGYEGHPLTSGTHAIAQKNVILQGKLMDPQGTLSDVTRAVWGIRIDPDLGTVHGNIVVDKNIVAHVKHNGSNEGITQLDRVQYHDNVIFNWWQPQNMSAFGWVNSDVSIDSYMKTVNQTGGLDKFVENCKRRGIDEWDTRFSANRVNDYIRSGFTRQ